MTHMKFRSDWEMKMFKDATEIKNDYLQRFPNAFNRSEPQYHKLHQFFSPHPVPKGLDEWTIRMCIFLYEESLKRIPEATRLQIIQGLPAIPHFVTKRFMKQFIMLFLEQLVKK